MISYRIQFALRCSVCGQADKWNIPGLAQSHADWIEEIRKAGRVMWTCQICSKQTDHIVDHATSERKETK